MIRMSWSMDFHFILYYGQCYNLLWVHMIVWGMVGKLNDTIVMSAYDCLGYCSKVK